MYVWLNLKAIKYYLVKLSTYEASHLTTSLPQGSYRLATTPSLNLTYFAQFTISFHPMNLVSLVWQNDNFCETTSDQKIEMPK